jgi:hypothetical protein
MLLIITKPLALPFKPHIFLLVPLIQKRLGIPAVRGLYKIYRSINDFCINYIEWAQRVLLEADFNV